MCIFCEKILRSDIVYKGKKIVVVRDEYPVTKGHVLILPIRHVPNYFYLTKEEHEEVRDYIYAYSEAIMSGEDCVDGFNIGWNVGGSAGQTIEHAHCHLIPRRTGDCENPTGGVRNVIPEMGDYLK